MEAEAHADPEAFRRKLDQLVSEQVALTIREPFPELLLDRQGADVREGRPR